MNRETGGINGKYLIPSYIQVGTLFTSRMTNTWLGIRANFTHFEWYSGYTSGVYEALMRSVFSKLASNV